MRPDGRGHAVHEGEPGGLGPAGEEGGHRVGAAEPGGHDVRIEQFEQGVEVTVILLVIPRRRTRFLGAVTLMFVLTGAVTTHIVNHDPAVESWAAPAHLVVMTVIPLAHCPADWRHLLPGAGPDALPRLGPGGTSRSGTVQVPPF